MARLTVEITIAMMMVVLASDLLYLYYTGCWYDPIKWIEITEVVLLYGLSLSGISYVVWRVRR